MSDDRTQLRAQVGVPADRDLPPGRHLLHREHLMTQIRSEQIRNDQPRRRPAARRRPTTRAMLATAAAAALIAGIGVKGAISLSSHSASPQAGPTLPAGTAGQSATQSTPAGLPVASTLTLLDKVASAAAAQPATAMGPGQYFYVKTESLYEGVPGETTFNAQSTTHPLSVAEEWIPQGPGKESLSKVSGYNSTAANAPKNSFSTTVGAAAQPASSSTVGEAAATPDSSSTVAGSAATPASGSSNPNTTVDLLFPTYAYLQSLPTNPQQLLDVVAKQAKWDGNSSSASEFELIGQLEAGAVLPPQTAAALYRAAALIPGVTLVPDATDALGRHGVGISITDQVNGVRLTWIFSTSTYQYLGERDDQAATTASAPKGKLIGLSAILARGVADSLGGTPSLIK